MIHPALSRGMAKAGGMLASIGDSATIGESKPAVIKAKEIPEYVTNNFISKDTKNTLIKNEENNTTSKDKAKDNVDKAVYEFVTKAHNKGYSYADIEESLKLVTNIKQLPQLLNNMLDYSMWSFSKADDYELDSSGKLVKKLYSSNRQRQKKLYEALED